MFDAVQDQFHQFLATTSRPNTSTTLPPTPIIPISNPFPFSIHHHPHHHASSTIPSTSNTPYPIHFHDHHPNNFPPPAALLHEHHQTLLLPPTGASHFLHQQPPPLPLQLHHHQKFGGGEKQASGLLISAGGGSRAIGGGGGLFSAAANIALLQEKERTMISMRPAAETAVVEDHSWSSEEVLDLLRIRSSMENWFPNLTWEHVSRKLGEHGFKRSAEKCKEKFEEESRYFNNNMDSTTTFATAAAANTTTTTASSIINCNKNNNYNRLFGDFEVEDLYHHQQQDHHHHVILNNPHHHDHLVADNQTSPDHDHHNHEEASAAAAEKQDDQINTYNQGDSDPDIEVDEVQVVVVEEEDKIGQHQISVEAAANSDKMEDHHHQSVLDDHINHRQDCSTASHDHNYDDMIVTEKTKRPSTSSSSSLIRKRKRHHHHQHQHHHQNNKIKFEIFKGFCEKIMNQMISQQEELHNKILEDMIKRDEEKIAREEAWMKHEMERINQEIQVRAQEQAVAGDRQAKIIEFLNKFSTSCPAAKGNTMINTTTSSTTPAHDHHHHQQHHRNDHILMKVPIPTTTMSAEASTLIDKDPSTSTPSMTIPSSSSTLMAQINPSSLTTQHSSSNNNMPTSPSTTDEISKIPMPSSIIHHVDQPNSSQNPNTNPMISTQVDLAPNIHQPPSTSPNSSQLKSQQIVSTYKYPNTCTRGTDHQDSSTAAGKRWPRDEVLTLINIRCSLYSNVASGPNCDAAADHPDDHNNSKAPLWERISQKMLELGYKRSAKRCKEKWENINKYFRKTKDSNKKRSLDSRTCPYFHQLKHLYNQGTLLTGGSADQNNRGSANPEFSESPGTGGTTGGGDHGT